MKLVGKGLQVLVRQGLDSRVGLRIGDLRDPSFPQMVTERMEEMNRVLVAMGGEALDDGDLQRHDTGDGANAVSALPFGVVEGPVGLVDHLSRRAVAWRETGKTKGYGQLEGLAG